MNENYHQFIFFSLTNAASSNFVPHASCDEVGCFPGLQFYCKRFCIFLFVKGKIFLCLILFSKGIADVVKVW